MHLFSHPLWRKLLASITVAGLSPTPAGAQTGASVSPWAGPYFGVSLGAAVSPYEDDRFGGLPVFVSSMFRAQSHGAAHSLSIRAPDGNGLRLIGGGQIGYNVPLGGGLIAGLEADLQLLTTDSRRLYRTGFWFSGHDAIISTVALEKMVDYLGTLRGRLGYLVTPTLLAYGTGGLSYGGFGGSAGILQTLQHCPGGGCAGPITGKIDPAEPLPQAEPSFSNPRMPRPGWIAGGGLEWMFLSDWSLRAEYLHYDLGRLYHNFGSLVLSDDKGVPVLGVNPRAQLRFSGDLLRFGVNHHFESPATVEEKESAKKASTIRIDSSIGMTTRKGVDESLSLTVAPSGLDNSGVTLHLDGLNSGWYYEEQQEGSGRRTIHGHNVYASNSIGYQFANSATSAELAVGLDYGHATQSPIDPENRVSGTAWGAKISGSASHQFNDVYSIAADGSYSTRWRSFSLGVRPGVTLESLTIGPEVAYYGTFGYRAITGGLYASGFRIDPVSLNFRCGFFYDTYIKRGAYFAVGSSYEF